MATPKTRPPTIVLTGKSGAGKSSLMQILMEGKATQKHSAEPVTDKFIAEEFTKNGVTIRIIDTPGLMGTKEDSKELKMCSVYTEGKADLLLYCIPVGAGHKFHEANPEIMLSLTEGFGKKIWDHCVLVLTMSNLALNEYTEDYPCDQTTAEKEYAKFLKEFSDKFEKQLHDLGIDKHVKTVFEIEKNENAIIAIPAGKNPHSKVLANLKYSLPDYCEEKN